MSLSLWTVIIVIMCLVTANQSKDVSALSSSSGIIVPLYGYPDATWDELIKEKIAHPSVPILAIINPDNGPGLRNENFTAGVQKLQAVGITVLGYVYTHWGDRELPSIIGDIDNYKNWYNVNGLLFDEMSHVQGNETFYKHLNDYAKSIGFSYTVGNPGTDTLPSYIGTVDNIIIYENQGLPLISYLHGWHANFTKSNFSFVSYGVDHIDKTFVTNAAQHVKYMYITDSTLPDPFRTLPKYLDNLIGMLDNKKAQDDTVSAFKNYAFAQVQDAGTMNDTKIATSNQNNTPAIPNGTAQIHVGFSHINFTRGVQNVIVTGQYTNGNTPYKIIFLRIDLYDQSSNMVGTGCGTLSDIGANDTKPFDMVVRDPGPFVSYDLTIDNAISANLFPKK